MMNTNKKTPKLRFKGFTDDWEQRKFGEIMTFLNGRAYKQDELLGDGKYKVLRVGNFYTNDSWYYSDLELDDKYYAMNGDLLYTWSATFGPHIWKGEKVIYHYHIWKLVLQDKIDKIFALQLLEVDKANIMSDKNGSTMVHITKQGMENKQTILPISLNEQKQIAKFLSSMDKLITLHQRKLEKLKLNKGALLQKLFPQKGCTIPDVRFKGFTDAWEQRKLGECMDSFEYGLNAAAKEYDGMHKYIRITDIDDETHNFIQSNLTSPDIDFNSDVSDYKLNVNDIVFARTGASVGKTYLYNQNDGDLYYAGFLIRGKVNEDCDAGFIYQNTLTTDYDSFIRITSQRSGQPGVNSKEYTTFRLNIPCKGEQEKISKLLNRLDKLFTLHQHKLDRLISIKKGLLQQLFV